MSYLCSPWILVDRIVASAATDVSFSSTGGSVRQYPVNGNIDGGYKLRWDLIGSAAFGLNVQIRMNGVNTNQNFATNTAAAGAVGGNTGTATGVLGTTASVSQECVGEWACERSATGAMRAFRTIYYDRSNVGIVSGVWNDSATNITSIQLLRTGSTTFTGTIKLYVKNPQRR